METRIKQIQTAMFARNFSISNDLERAALFTEIHGHTNSIFNGLPTQLPIPNDVPPEVPRFILNSTDGRFNCNIALSRIDIFYKVPDTSTENFEQLLITQKNNTENIFSFLISKGIIINRIGFIASGEKILSSEEGNGLNYLRNNFIQDNKFNNPKELTLSHTRSGRSENFEMNNLVTLNTNLGVVIRIQTDVNTVAERMDTANFNLENFNEIIDYAARETLALIDNFPNI